MLPDSEREWHIPMFHLLHDQNFEVNFPLLHPNLSVSFYWITQVHGMVGQVNQWINSVQNVTDNNRQVAFMPDILLLGIKTV